MEAEASVQTGERLFSSFLTQWREARRRRPWCLPDTLPCLSDPEVRTRSLELLRFNGRWRYGAVGEAHEVANGTRLSGDFIAQQYPAIGDLAFDTTTTYDEIVRRQEPSFYLGGGTVGLSRSGYYYRIMAPLSGDAGADARLVGVYHWTSSNCSGVTEALMARRLGCVTDKQMLVDAQTDGDAVGDDGVLVRPATYRARIVERMLENTLSELSQLPSEAIATLSDEAISQFAAILTDLALTQETDTAGRLARRALQEQLREIAGLLLTVGAPPGKPTPGITPERA